MQQAEGVNTLRMFVDSTSAHSCQKFCDREVHLCMHVSHLHMHRARVTPFGKVYAFFGSMRSLCMRLCVAVSTIVLSFPESADVLQEVVRDGFAIGDGDHRDTIINWTGLFSLPYQKEWENQDCFAIYLA